ncbi:hypothetical protein LNA76_05745 [Alcaligenes sp. MMA]|uniref:CHAT domain-containing protein n=1 Tax=Alcaligenes sp. MMA TaxID=2893019 RepID=UPI001E4B1979|nr:CHAT domain-containing protein [Alcaligenes sp. MMA]MCC9162827.1 hypothetical protein [Alcaligenes sp. MMA]
MITSTIRHIIAMPPDIAEDPTPFFQGFSKALFQDYQDIFRVLIDFPHDIMDIFLTGSDLILSKMVGSNLDLHMIRVDLFDDMHIDHNYPLTVIWSSTKSVELVENQLNLFTVRPLHITVGSQPGVLSLSDLTSDAANHWLLDLLSRASSINSMYAEFYASVSKQPPTPRDEGSLAFVPALHNCTIPLLKTLELYGYRIRKGKGIAPAADSNKHVEGMLQLSRVIDGLRHSLGTLPPMRKNDAILFCPSIYTYLYRANSQFWQKIYRELDRDRRDFLKKSLIRNKGYGNSSLQINENAIFNPYEDEILGTLLKIRQSELHFFTTIIALAAANQFVPALRLPNSVMLHHDQLSVIYGLVNSNHRERSLELNRKIAHYSRTIYKEIGAKLVNEIFGEREKLLTVCDFPIEWLSINLIPVMFRHEISRVPSTPGNVTTQTLLSGQRLLIPFSAMTKVLVIRSLDPNDHIYDILSSSIDHFKQSSGLENITLKLVDVASEAELIVALNSFEGAIVIFDCHGNHGGEESHAWLHIGQERVDVWQLANRARVPPIVILSACSTHPLDGSHASVANGLLRSGALSVIGTFAPVDAIHAGIFTARLLYRLSAFVPIATKRRPRSWREIVTGFLRMSYVSDVLKDLRDELKKISEEEHNKIHFEANIAINSDDPDWADKFISNVKSITKMNEEETNLLWMQRYQFVETMLFNQLGRPENIIIYNDDVDIKTPINS